jgi:serine/threonine-protein kinase
MAVPALCPNCGHELPANASLGLCPVCLLSQGLDDHLLSLEHAGEPEMTAISKDEVSDRGFSIGRYQVQSRLGHGAMGEVFRSRDLDLGREVALKALREEHREDLDLIQRFVEEAQIGGQLVHPGIVPTYELGTLADGRPFFTMKLVKGHRLYELLKSRPSPFADLARFLAIFEQVCQTVAYAHARGVIHRDLKSSNIMVGSFGEVQVMDWGLAKVLPRGATDKTTPPDVDETQVTTVRSGSGSDGSHVGSVLGTPAYMAPEQARAELHQVDERADVFALGSILCEILTCQPAYTGASPQATMLKAQRGETAYALTRLDSSGADPELIDLARRCLAVGREKRPRHAGEVAAVVAAHAASVQERLRKAELERVEAEARAEEEIKRRALADDLAREANARANEERRRRQMTVGLAASVLALAGLAGGTWLAGEQSRVQRRTSAALVLAEAHRLHRLARDAETYDPAKWSDALTAVERAEGLLAYGGDPGQKREADALKASITADYQAVPKEAEWLQQLIDIRATKAEGENGSSAEAGYAAIFHDAGIVPDGASAQEAASKIQSRRPTVAQALVTALDDWASVRRAERGDEAAAGRLLTVARLADPDPWRDRLRAALAQSRGKDRLKALQSLAGSARVDELPAVSLDLLGVSLLDEGEPQMAADLLRQAQRAHPRDGWLKYNLARALEKVGRTEEAIRYLMAARTIHPATAHELAHMLENRGETDEAYGIFQDLVRLRPTEARHQVCLGRALKNYGLASEAKPVLERAIAALDSRLRLNRSDASAHSLLGMALSYLDRHDQALIEFREEVRLSPNHSHAHLNLASSLATVGKLDDAIAEFRTAIRLDPNLAEAHAKLGKALSKQGKLDDAIAEFRTAIRIQPDLALGHTELGFLLSQCNRDYAGAESEFRTRIRITPGIAHAHVNLGSVLQMQGKLDDAIAEFRTAIRIQPDFAGGHIALGVFLCECKQDYAGAEAELRTAIRISPSLAEAHSNLGIALRQQGKLDDAIGEFLTAIRIKPDAAHGHVELGVLLCDCKLDYAGAESEFRTAIQIDPKNHKGHENLGVALDRQGKREQAIAEYYEAIRLDPSCPNIHDRLGIVLSDRGQLEEAIGEFRTAIRLKPDDGHTHTNLGIGLSKQGKLEEAIAEYRVAIRLKPDGPLAHYSLGNALRAQRNRVEAIAEYRMARDHAQPGSQLAQLIERALTSSDQ